MLGGPLDFCHTTVISSTVLTLQGWSQQTTSRTKSEGVVESEFGQELEKTCNGIDMLG